MSEQTTISFANLNVPQEGVVVVFAEDGPKLTPAAKDLDKTSKGLLSRAAEISGFKGKKETSVDLLAPSELKFSRLVMVGMDKTGDYGAEDWLNLGGTVRGLLTGKEAPTAHIVLDAVGRDIAPADIARFALGAALPEGFDPAFVGRRQRNGQPLREQIIAGVAGGDFDLIGLAAQANDVVRQNNFSLCHTVKRDA